jgi:hypothetical protein
MLETSSSARNNPQQASLPGLCLFQRLDLSPSSKDPAMSVCEHARNMAEMPGVPWRASFLPQGRIGMTLGFKICKTYVSGHCVKSRIFHLQNLGGKKGPNCFLQRFRVPSV